MEGLVSKTKEITYATLWLFIQVTQTEVNVLVVADILVFYEFLVYDVRVRRSQLNNSASEVTKEGNARTRALISIGT